LPSPGHSDRGLGERYATIVWIGITIIAVGISLKVRATVRPGERP
jgi:hypothetical protein